MTTEITGSRHNPESGGKDIAIHGVLLQNCYIPAEIQEMHGHVYRHIAVKKQDVRYATSCFFIMEIATGNHCSGH